MDCVGHQLYRVLTAGAVDNVDVCMTLCSKESTCYGFSTVDSEPYCYFKKASCESEIAPGPANTILFIKRFMWENTRTKGRFIEQCSGTWDGELLKQLEIPMKHTWTWMLEGHGGPRDSCNFVLNLDCNAAFGSKLLTSLHSSCFREGSCIEKDRKQRKTFWREADFENRTEKTSFCICTLANPGYDPWVNLFWCR